MNATNLIEKVGRYRVSRELGRGGMAVVYLAQDPFIGRPVALKTPLTPPPADPARFELYQKIFFSEAKAAGSLMHPHIVSVYDATMEKDFCYLIMEYVDGVTLKEHCRNRALLPFEKLVKIIFQCAKALDYAHRNGVIHRDIKPSNILLSSRGEAKISDFGIATMENVSDLPTADNFTGSVYYSSPEQLRNEPLAAQSDLFSLGIVMYELLTGVKPFDADTDISIFYKIANNDPEPLKKHRPDVPDPLGHIIERVLEKDTKKRYQNGMQLANDLSASFDNLKSVDLEIDFEEKFNALKKITFFKDFSSNELAEVLRVTQWFRFHANDQIISEGEIEDSFYVIITGEVLVKKNGKPLAVLKQGDCFGEMAYLGKIKRTAAIESLTDSALMKINSSVIDQTSNQTQLRFYRVFSSTLIGRLSRTSELLLKETD